MRRALTLLGLLGVVGGAFAAAEVGKPAPEFTATDINGQTRKLAITRARSSCWNPTTKTVPFCHNHYRTGAMQDLQRDLAAKGVVWLVVNSVTPKNPSHRSPEAARKEWASQKINATAWLDDSSGAIGKAYGMRTTPHMFVIDQAGILVYEGAIDDRPSPEGDPRTAHNYVREAVQKLEAGQQLAVSQTKPYGCGVKYGS